MRMTILLFISVSTDPLCFSFLVYVHLFIYVCCMFCMCHFSVATPAVLDAQKASSAMSAARAIADHLKDWLHGSGDRLVSMGVCSDGPPLLAQSSVQIWTHMYTRDCGSVCLWVYNTRLYFAHDSTLSYRYGLSLDAPVFLILLQSFYDLAAMFTYFDIICMNCPGNPYKVKEGLIFSFPVKCFPGGKWAFEKELGPYLSN